MLHMRAATSFFLNELKNVWVRELFYLRGIMSGKILPCIIRLCLMECLNASLFLLEMPGCAHYVRPDRLWSRPECTWWKWPISAALAVSTRITCVSCLSLHSWCILATRAGGRVGKRRGMCTQYSANGFWEKNRKVFTSLWNEFSAKSGIYRRDGERFLSKLVPNQSPPLS